MAKSVKTADEIAEITGADVDHVRRGMATFKLVQPDEE